MNILVKNFLFLFSILIPLSMMGMENHPFSSYSPYKSKPKSVIWNQEKAHERDMFLHMLAQANIEEYETHKAIGWDINCFFPLIVDCLVIGREHNGELISEEQYQHELALAWYHIQHIGAINKTPQWLRDVYDKPLVKAVQYCNPLFFICALIIEHPSANIYTNKNKEQLYQAFDWLLVHNAQPYTTFLHDLIHTYLLSFEDLYKIIAKINLKHPNFLAENVNYSLLAKLSFNQTDDQHRLGLFKFLIGKVNWESLLKANITSLLEQQTDPLFCACIISNIPKNHNYPQDFLENLTPHESILNESNEAKLFKLYKAFSFIWKLRQLTYTKETYLSTLPQDLVIELTNYLCMMAIQPELSIYQKLLGSLKILKRKFI